MDQESSAALRMSPTEVIERLHSMRHQEDSTAYRCRDFLSYSRAYGEEQSDAHNSSPRASSPENDLDHGTAPIDESCRMRMVEWSYQVIDCLKLRRETVEISTRFLDRFLSTAPHEHCARDAIRSRRVFQLASMTCLYMAIKLNEQRELDFKYFVDLSRGFYSRLDMSEMEATILRKFMHACSYYVFFKNQTSPRYLILLPPALTLILIGKGVLDWRVMCPTACSFLDHMCQLLPISFPASFQADVGGASLSSFPSSLSVPSTNGAIRPDDVLELLADDARFQIELSVADYDMIDELPSTIAVAAILNAVNRMSISVFSLSDRLDFVKVVCASTNKSAYDVSVTRVQARLNHCLLRFGHDASTAMIHTTMYSSSEDWNDEDERTKRPRTPSPVCVSRTGARSRRH